MNLFSRIPSQFVFRHLPHVKDAPILEVSNLVVRYDGLMALNQITFSLVVGERVAVVGPNGAGKSTLFKVIAGVLSAENGEVKVFGTHPGSHTCIAYLPQRSQVDWSFPVTVADVVMMGRIGQIGLFRRPKSSDWELVRECLALVGMEELANRQIDELSGGQQQRMFIARALAQEAELMLMDEPLSGLDVAALNGILEIFEELRERGVTVMVALHDLHLATERFDRVMLLNREIRGFGPPGEVITAERLTQAYEGHLQMIATADGTLVVGDTCCDEGIKEVGND